MNDFYNTPVGLLTKVSLVNLRVRFTNIKILEITFTDNLTNEERISYVPLPKSTRLNVREDIGKRIYLETAIKKDGKFSTRARHFYCVISAVAAIQSLLELGVESRIGDVHISRRFFTYYPTTGAILKAYENRDTGLTVIDGHLLSVGPNKKADNLLVLTTINNNNNLMPLSDSVNVIYFPIPNRLEVNYSRGKFYVNYSGTVKLTKYRSSYNTSSYQEFRIYLEELLSELEDLEVNIRHTGYKRTSGFFTARLDTEWLPKQFRESLKKS